MFFQIYGETAGWQLLGWLMVFTGLVVMNEIARRSKAGGIACFLILPAVLTVYFIAIYVGATMAVLAFYAEAYSTERYFIAIIPLFFFLFLNG